MSSTKPTQSNFSAGEIASNLLGRIDHERYQNGILRGENCVVTPQGSLSKRNGTKAVHAFNVTDEDIALSFGDGRSEVTGCRTIPVVFSATEAYVLILVKTTTGVKGYIYSNNNLELLKYQTNDDEVKVVNGVIQVEVLTIPNWNNNGTITLDSNTYFFDHRLGSSSVSHVGSNFFNGSSSLGYLVNRVTGDRYEFPGRPGSFVFAERQKKYRFTSRKPYTPARWYMGAGESSGSLSTIRWTYSSLDGSDLDFPTTGWSLTDGNTIGSNQTWGLSQETTRFVANTEITIGDGFSFSYSASELNEIDYVVYDGSLILTHRNHKPIVISRGLKGNTVSGVDDWRQWTARVFSFSDGPYLESSKGKQLPLGGNFSQSNDSISLRLKKNSDVSIVISNKTALIESHTNLAIGDFVEYSNNSNILLGSVVSLHSIAKGELYLESYNPIAINVDDKAIIESDHTSIENVTMLFSDTAIWSKSLEGNYIKHSQRNVSGEIESTWFRIDRYVGQKIFKSSHTDGENTVRTWQAKDAAGDYNMLQNQTEVIMDAIEVTAVTGEVHYLTSGKSPTGVHIDDYNAPIWATGVSYSVDDWVYQNNFYYKCLVAHSSSVFANDLTAGNWTQGTIESLPDGESLYLKDRVISYNITSDKEVFHYTRDKGRFIRVELNGEKAWGRIYEIIPDSEATEWVAATSYSVDDRVINDGKYYNCESVHTSGVFSTDLDSGKWVQIYNSSEVNVKFDIAPPVVKNGKEQFSTNIWQFGCYHDASGETDDDDEANYPSVVEVIDDRVFFGGGNLTPDLWHLSSSNDYRNFGPTDEFGEVLATSAISYRLPTGAGMIKWVSSAQNLIIGTTTGEYKVAASEDLATLAPTNIYVRKQTDFGSFSNSALTIDGSIIFIAAPGKAIRELTYSFQNDSYRSVNISVVAQHLFSNADPIQDMAYISHPNNLILFRTKRGRLIALTYDKENRIVAACPWSISGLKPYTSTPAGGIGDYETTVWAASTEYLLGDTVMHNGMYFQCVQRHTSAVFFEADYVTNNWVHTGAPVISLCSLPANDGRSSDKFFMATYRNASYRIVTDDDHSSDILTPSDSDFLCLEILEPYSTDLSDSYYESNTANNKNHLDFHIKMEDRIDGSFAMPYQANPALVFLDITDLETSTSGFNSHLSTIFQAIAAEGAYASLEGISSSIFAVKAPSVSNRPSTTDNAFVSQSDELLIILDDLHAMRNSLYGSNYDSYVKIRGGGAQYSHNEGSIITGHSLGFTFPCVITPLPLEFIGSIEQGGGSIGRVRRLNKVDLLVEDTGPFSIVSESMYEHNSDNYQFTGIVEADLDFGNDERQQFSIVSFSANRLNLLSIGTELDIKK